MTKYKSKNQITKGLPVEFRELADSALDHLGTMLDHMTLADVFESGALALCGYYGYKAGGLQGVGVGVLGYKLATSSGTPSQIAGLVILTTIGILSIPRLTQAQADLALANDESMWKDKIPADATQDQIDSIIKERERLLAEMRAEILRDFGGSQNP